MNVGQYSQLRFYDQSVFMIEGAQVTKVVFHDAGGSKSDCSINIDGNGYTFTDGVATWEGSMNPFICKAYKQSRLSGIDVTIAPTDPTGIDAAPAAPSFRLVFDGQGRCVGSRVPARRGTYLVREGENIKKILVK